MDNTNINSQEKMLSLGAGGALALLGVSLLVKGRTGAALGALAAGAGLLYRGQTCHCALYEKLGIDTSEDAAPLKEQVSEKVSEISDKLPAAGKVVGKAAGPVQLVHAVTVNKPAQEIFEFWRDAENYARFMPQIESVEKTADTRLKWTAQTPTGQTLHWESEIVEEKPNELLRWETQHAEGVAGAALPHTGQLSLKELGHDRGTEVRLEMTYHEQSGALGAALAALFKAIPSQFAVESLRRFKQLMEAGEIAEAQNN